MKTINKAVETASDFADEALNKTTKVAHEAADMVAEKGEQLRNVEQRLMKETSNYIRDNPITSMGIAIGVGFLLSKLFSVSDR